MAHGSSGCGITLLSFTILATSPTEEGSSAMANSLELAYIQNFKNK